METESAQPNGMVNGVVNGDVHEEAGRTSKPPMCLSYDKYKSMAESIVVYMQAEELKLTEDGDGLRRSDVVNWYLKFIEHEIDSEKELTEKKTLLDKVLDRLIHHDGVILALKEWSIPEEGYEPAEIEDPYLVVHPNYEVQH